MTGQGQPREELTSWKEIAEHLRVAVRTAQTWEREKGLPVRRMPGERGRVSADPAELSRWKAAALHGNHLWSHPLVVKIYAVVSTVLLIAAVVHERIYHVGASHERIPSSFRLEWQSLVVLDQKGAELWRKTFPETIESAAYTGAAMSRHRKIEFVDIDADGRLETLFVYAPANSAKSPSALYCFSSDGEERWNFAPARAKPSNQQPAQPTHVLNDLLVARSDEGSEPNVLLLDCQLPGHVARLFVLSARGEMKATYGHRGHLGMLETGDVDDCGVREVLLGGFAGERQQAELIVLDVPCDRRGPNGKTLARPPAPLRIKEKAIIVFPRTCVNQRLEESNRIARIVDNGEVLSVGVSELIEDPEVEAVYQLNRKLLVQTVWFSDALKNLHRTLEAQGLLSHPLTDEEIESFKGVLRLEPHPPEKANLD